MNFSMVSSKTSNFETEQRIAYVTHHAKISLFACFLVLVWALVGLVSVTFGYEEVISLEYFYTGLVTVSLLVFTFGTMAYLTIKSKNWSPRARNVLYIVNTLLHVTMVGLVWYSSNMFSAEENWITPAKVRDNVKFQITMAFIWVYFIYGAMVPPLALFEMGYMWISKKLEARKTGDVKLHV